ncbi:hypothetical protein BDZ94DRAFT_1282415 [Collybia nuda]|uniref:N-acetyltransferase domain-containing protein n=1 Tax=Collybia nuda TaxID=64659 RepID=A0A9P6CF56_9AGAR|nr:hypothetical protein BDZ94DRAFT_1282415 [Collybia nuda]
MSPTIPNIHIRLAKPEEYGQIAVLVRKAFIRDPMMNYIGNLKEQLPVNTENANTKDIETFSLFFLHSCHYVGGLVTVGVKKEPETSKEEIACVAFWCPPNKRLALWKVPTLLRSGILKVLKVWGWAALKCLREYLDLSHVAQEESFMSALMHEAYNNAPAGVPFILEATTPNSRDRYTHLGFEVVEEITLGKGKVNTEGIVASGQEAVGFPIWTMINVSPDFLE